MDNWHERFTLWAFRAWRVVRIVLRRTSSPWLANVYSIGGFALAIIAIPFVFLAWPAVFVAGLGMIAGMTYALDGYVKRFFMRVAPGQDSKISPGDFYHAPLVPDGGYRLVHPVDASRAQLYPYVDLSDHSPFIQAENDLTRDQRYRLYERWYGLCPDAFMHLEVLQRDQWRPISVSIVLPLSAEGFRAITTKDKAHRLSVVDLDHEGIMSRPDRRHPCLLIDTWIVDREGGYGGAGHGKTESRGGNANLLVLRHVTRFWNSATRFRHVVFVTETANPRLVSALEMMSFTKTGTSNIGEDFYRTSPEQMDAMDPAAFGRLKGALRKIESVRVHQGTAPVPAGWYYK
jgi:hypothetical protein